MNPDFITGTLTPPDRLALRVRGISFEEVSRQVVYLRRPPPPPPVVRPCTLGDGIESLAPPRRKSLARKIQPTDHFRPQGMNCFVPDPVDGGPVPTGESRLAQLANRAISDGRLSKFVPASGAATRLFAPGVRWHPHLTDLLGEDVSPLLRRPKAFLPVHRVGKVVRTLFEEHLWDMVPFRDRFGRARVHFTVAPEFLAEFRRLGKELVARFSRRTAVRFQLSFSVQDPSTNTLAWEEGKGWVRSAEGGILFRPGGHGALLGNLQRTGGDLVCIKNVDNVPHPFFQSEGHRWRKVLIGRLIEVQTEAWGWIRSLRKKSPSLESVSGAERFLHNVLGLKGAPSSTAMKIAWALDVLDRPWRVCGMVPNVGEPGGGPFWVLGKWGPSRQILEGSQLGKFQKTFSRRSTHFNPVDLVVGLRDWEGCPFDLPRYADPSQVLVSTKIIEGRTVRTLEHPGLWNGGMAHWNTLFVQIPISVFHPIKVVTDLLRSGHVGKPGRKGRVRS